MKRFGAVLALLVLLVLPAFAQVGSQREDLIRADYGSGTQWVDVTQRVRSLIRGEFLNFRVDNDTLGIDPRPGEVKVLQLQLRSTNGSTRQVTFQEKQYVNLQVNSGGGPYAGSGSGNLQILRADYGVDNRYSDVTTRLSSQIRGDQLNLLVNNDTMGGDPAKGRDKTLKVQYAYGGRQSQMVVNEGDTLNLPTDNVPLTSQALRCESNNNARNYCPVDARGGVQMIRQISGSACIQGSTWGYDSNQIWVDKGCRADFEVSSPFGATASSTPYGTYMTIPSGTQLAIRTNEAIDSAKSKEGQQFSAVMYTDVLDSSGAMAIPKGSDVQLVIRSTAGSDLVLDIDSLVVAGQRYAVSTSDLQQKGRQGIGANRRTAEMVGGGAAVGAIVGAIVGGGKGAAIGAAVGAAGGAGVQVLTKGKEVKVPSETILNFRLDTDLHLQPTR